MLLHQRETLADGGEHAQGETVDLEDAQLVEIVLVPLDDGAVGHGRVLDRHELAQGAAGHDHAARVLREMAGEADKLRDEFDQLPAAGRIGINARLAAADRERRFGLQWRRIMLIRTRLPDLRPLTSDL
jgi:hypothetical protein